MSNIRGLRDYEGNRGGNRPPGGPDGGGGGGDNDPAQAMPFLRQSNTSPAGDPRKESFWDMIRNVCCPSFVFASFIVVISIVDCVFFAIELVYGGLQIPGEFLRPGQKALFDMGGKVPYLMRYKWQIWRFLTPVLLHAHFGHLLYNLVTQLIFGVNIEAKMGRNQVIIVYFTCAIGGNLLSALCNSTLSVGASTAIFGLLGSQLAYLALNWRAFGAGSNKEKTLFITVLIILMNFLAGMRSDSTDNWGHLGGLATGVLMGLFMYTPIRRYEQYEKTAALIGKISIAVYFVLLFGLFYTVAEPLSASMYV